MAKQTPGYIFTEALNKCHGLAKTEMHQSLDFN